MKSKEETKMQKHIVRLATNVTDGVMFAIFQ